MNGIRIPAAADRWVRRILLVPFVVAMVVHGSTKPSPVITEEGIRLTRCDVTSRRIDVAWESDDARIVPGETVFHVQASFDGGPFLDVAATTNLSARIMRFTVDRNARWRVRADVTPSDGEGGGAQ